MREEISQKPPDLWSHVSGVRFKGPLNQLFPKSAFCWSVPPTPNNGAVQLCPPRNPLSMILGTKDTIRSCHFMQYTIFKITLVSRFLERLKWKVCGMKKRHLYLQDPKLKQVNKIQSKNPVDSGVPLILGHAAVGVSNHQNKGVVPPGHWTHSKTSKPEAPALTCFMLWRLEWNMAALFRCSLILIAWLIACLIDIER